MAVALKPRIHDVPDDLLAAIDWCYEQGWTDGLPVVPPVVDRVDAMLAADARPRETVIAHHPATGLDLSLHAGAVNAVMAGCLPEYFPVVVAAFEAMNRPDFNFHGSTASTGGSAPLLIVSGPYAAADAAALNVNDDVPFDFPDDDGTDMAWYRAVGEPATGDERYQDAAGWCTIEATGRSGPVALALALRESSTVLVDLVVDEVGLTVTARHSSGGGDAPVLLSRSGPGGHSEAEEWLRYLGAQDGSVYDTLTVAVTRLDEPGDHPGLEDYRATLDRFGPGIRLLAADPRDRGDVQRVVGVAIGREAPLPQVVLA